MFLYRILCIFQIASFFISDHVEATITTAVTPSSSVIVTAPNSTAAVLPVATSSVAAIISPSQTVATTTSPAPPATNTTTSQPPPGGELQAVALTVADMTTAEFEKKKDNFITTVEKVVENYCSNPSQNCDTASRKRRETTAYQVYIVPGYPKQSPLSSSDLLVAFFVSIGDNKLLPKNVLFAIVQEPEYKGNLSTALGKEITGAGPLHYDIITFSPTDSSGTSGKTKVLYLFFAVFSGVVVILGLCICVTCWYGYRNERENDRVRPLTTSNLELVEN